MKSFPATVSFEHLRAFKSIDKKSERNDEIAESETFYPFALRDDVRVKAEIRSMTFTRTNSMQWSFWCMNECTRTTLVNVLGQSYKFRRGHV